jgi:hypothetical protein
VAEETEQNAINNIQQLLSEQHEVRALINDSAELEQPENFMERIKTNLSIDRDINPEIETSTKEYNIAVCWSIGLGMMATLPRELRDMVYEYLTTGVVIVHEDPDHSSARVRHLYDNPGALYFTKYPRTVDDALCAAHWWRDEVVGVDIALELMESWYCNSTFLIKQRTRVNAPQPLGLQELIAIDRFKLGLQPERLITNFMVTITLLNDDFLPWTKSPDVILETLEGLLFLKETACITVSIRFWISAFDSDFPTEQQLNDFLQVVYPKLLRLRKAGYRLQVKIKRLYSFPTKRMKIVFDRWMRRLDEDTKV